MNAVKKIQKNEDEKQQQPGEDDSNLSYREKQQHHLSAGTVLF